MEYKTIALSLLLAVILPALALPVEETPAVHQQADQPVPSQAVDRKDVGVEGVAQVPADARVDESQDKSDLETANSFWGGYGGYGGYPYSGWRRGWGGGGYGGYGGWGGGYGGYGGYRGYRNYGGYGGWGGGYGGHGWRNSYWG